MYELCTSTIPGEQSETMGGMLLIKTRELHVSGATLQCSLSRCSRSSAVTMATLGLLHAAASRLIVTSAKGIKLQNTVHQMAPLSCSSHHTHACRAAMWGACGVRGNKERVSFACITPGLLEKRTA